MGKEPSSIESALEQTRAAIEDRFEGKLDESGSACLERVLRGTIRRSMEQGVLKWEEPIRSHVLEHAERLGSALDEMAKAEGSPIGERHVEKAADEIIAMMSDVYATPLCPTWREYES